MVKTYLTKMLACCALSPVLATHMPDNWRRLWKVKERWPPLQENAGGAHGERRVPVIGRMPTRMTMPKSHGLIGSEMQGLSLRRQSIYKLKKLFTSLGLDSISCTEEKSIPMTDRIECHTQVPGEDELPDTAVDQIQSKIILLIISSYNRSIMKIFL